MARRKKSLLTDTVDMVGKLPWWAGCALALLSYLLLHKVAEQPIVVNATTGQVRNVAMQSFWRGLATAGQYMLPVICLAGAALSAYRRRKRVNLITGATSSKAADTLDGISWQEFELLVGESFRLQGFQVSESSGSGADGGVDLVLRKRRGERSKPWEAKSSGLA